VTRLTKRQIASLKGRLESRAAALQTEIAEDVQRSSAAPYALIAGSVSDAGDAAVGDLLKDVQHAELERDAGELFEVGVALQLIEDGGYGICRDCGRNIDSRRLEAQPAARRCLDCQERRERLYRSADLPQL